MTQFEGAVVVVTGAASGLGRGTALGFARQGAAVGCIDVNRAGADETTSSIRRSGGAAAATQVDITDSADVARGIAELATALGPADVLVNVAGAALLLPVHRTTDADWRRCLDTNLTGTFYMCREVLPAMLDRGRGVIVNVASALARVAAPEFAAYSAAKAGIVALSRQMARDYGPVIRINSVSPGVVDTPPVRAAIARSADPAAAAAEFANSNAIARRMASVDEIVDVILFAASHSARFFHGQDLVPCGGQSVVAY